jgi:hypothetical protein
LDTATSVTDSGGRLARAHARALEDEAADVIRFLA